MTLPPLRVAPRNLVRPEAFESIRCEFRVAHRVRNVSVAQVVLDGSRIVTVVRELVATRVAKHVRMDGEGESGFLAGSSNHLPHIGSRHRRVALCDEDIATVGILATVLAQCSNLGSAEWMVGRGSIFRAHDEQQPMIEINLFPAERHEFANAKTMTVSDQD
jgi:hypothetical protein